MRREFKVGDRVVIDNLDNDVKESGLDITFEMTEWFWNQTLLVVCEALPDKNLCCTPADGNTGNCWYFSPSMLRHADERYKPGDMYKGSIEDLTPLGSAQEVTEGDLVVFIAESYGTSITKGRIYEVGGEYYREGEKGDNLVAFKAVQNPYQRDNGMFYDNWAKLPTEEPKSEIQSLVDKVNEGIEAAKNLVDKYPDKLFESHQSRTYRLAFRFNGPGSTVRTLSEVTPITLPKKPKPVFDAFTSKEGHSIYVKGDFVHVGCKVFRVQEALGALDKLINSNHSQYYIQGPSNPAIYASRIGLKYMTEEVLNWDDAEKLYKRLKKYKEEFDNA